MRCPLGEGGFFCFVAIISPKIQNSFGLWRMEVLKNVKVSHKYGTRIAPMPVATRIYTDFKKMAYG